MLIVLYSFLQYNCRQNKYMFCTFDQQEEPLPYELRTLPTLTLTMTYLLSEIADRGEDGKWGDWFDFLWNRTRGIRKVTNFFMHASLDKENIIRNIVCNSRNSVISVFPMLNNYCLFTLHVSKCTCLST